MAQKRTTAAVPALVSRKKFHFLCHEYRTPWSPWLLFRLQFNSQLQITIYWTNTHHELFINHSHADVLYASNSFFFHLFCFVFALLLDFLVAFVIVIAVAAFLAVWLLVSSYSPILPLETRWISLINPNMMMSFQDITSRSNQPFSFSN